MVSNFIVERYILSLIFPAHATSQTSPCTYKYRKNAKPPDLELTAPIIQDELVERCKLGDARSFAELYHKYAKAMYNTSLRIVGHTGDAEDVLQESFSDAFRTLGDFHFRSTFGAWLKKI